MTEKTKRIIQRIAIQEGVTPEHVVEEMQKAIRTAMATTNPQAQKIWKQIAPDGKEPTIDKFLEFMVGRVQSKIKGQR